MKDYRRLLIGSDVTLEEAMLAVERSGQGIAFVTDESRRLVGSVSDGDIRRVILRHVRLDSPVIEVMNPSPLHARSGTPLEKVREMMDAHRIRHVPVVDAQGRIADVVTEADAKTTGEHEHTAVIMCGGLGTRLKKLTGKTPKPLLPVGGQPILETIVDQLGKNGFRNVVLATNYKADMINGHFGNGDHLGMQIDYVHEDQPLGTAGALKLLDVDDDRPLLVMNGDILTKLSFQALLDYHVRGPWDMTACITTYDIEIPFGVVDTDGNGELTGIREKPSQRFFVNAGIYALNPSLIDLIPDDQYFDMTDLVSAARASGYRVGTFPIHEYWIDVGRLEDYSRANNEYESHFVAREVTR
jgi:dTDP-glucose pyrophosphorylase